MADRRMNRWEVQVQSNKGDVMTEVVNAYWDPEFDLTDESVVDAAASQVRWRNFRKGGKAAAETAYAVIGAPVLIPA